MQTVKIYLGLLLFCYLAFMQVSCVEETEIEDYSYGTWTNVGTLNMFPGSDYQEGGISVTLDNNRVLWLFGRTWLSDPMMEPLEFGHCVGITDAGSYPTDNSMQWLVDSVGQPKQIFPLSTDEIATIQDSASEIEYRLVPTGAFRFNNEAHVFARLERWEEGIYMLTEGVTLNLIHSDLSVSRVWKSEAYRLRDDVQFVGSHEDQAYLYVRKLEGFGCLRVHKDSVASSDAYYMFQSPFWQRGLSIYGSSVLAAPLASTVIYSDFLKRYLELYSNSGADLQYQVSEHPTGPWTNNGIVLVEDAFQVRYSDDGELAEHSAYSKNGGEKILLSYRITPSEPITLYEFKFHRP